MADCRLRFRLPLAAGALLLGPPLPLPLQAQTEPRLVAIVRLAQDGLADSARAELRRLMAAMQPGDSLYPEALYTSALVAVSDEERRLALRKVMVEHSGSAWADDAILLLGQLEWASGNPGGAVAQITKLIEDYPSSPIRAVAAFWGARAAADIRDGKLACRWAEIGLAAATEDVELRNQLEYQKQRCQAIITMQTDSAQVAARPPRDSTRPPAQAPPPAAPPTAGPRFYVQVVAVPAEAAAEPPATRLRRMSYPTVVVRESGFHKVRAGPFTTRAEAQAALARIRAQLGGRPFIVTVR